MVTRDDERRERYDGDEAIARLLKLAGPSTPVPGDRADRVRASVAREWSAMRRARSRRRAGLAAGLLAAAAVAAAAGVAWWRQDDPIAGGAVAVVERTEGAVHVDGSASRTIWGADGETLLAGSLVETGRLGRAALRLVDGTSVRLDNGSRLRLSSASELELQAGGIYVDSGPQAGAGLRVVTALGEIRDIGTQFEVRTGGEIVRVRVREGSVILSEEGRSWDAAAGEELTVRAAGGVARRSVAPYGAAWDWVARIAPPFELEGRTLAEFLAWVERESGRPVRYVDGALAPFAAEVVLHGTVEGLTPEQALAAVLPTCGLVHRLDGGGVSVSRARGEARSR